MTREIIQGSLKAQIFSKYGQKCYVCGYSLKPALRAHHIVPVSLGGSNDKNNFVLVCSNCHTLIHFYSSEKYRAKDIQPLVMEELSNESVERLNNLVCRIYQAKDEVKHNGNIWIGNNQNNQSAYLPAEAVEKVGKKNKFTSEQIKLLDEAFHLVIKHIPHEIFN